jgi:hypothetical protein
MAHKERREHSLLTEAEVLKGFRALGFSATYDPTSIGASQLGEAETSEFVFVRSNSSAPQKLSSGFYA